ncbi:MAG: tripartite tricarboxylate transporter substrate binding protein [Pseudomonadota bacterium]
MISRLTKTFAAALLLAGATTAVQAQDFPTRPIRMVIAFPPGGPTDFVGRLVAEKMKDLLGQPVIIENKAGANGAIGADFVAKAEPDGHTIFLTTVGAVAITPGMRNDLPYDPVRDFAPVSLVVRNTTVLVVKPDHPAKDAKVLAASAQEKPNTIPFASTGVGSMPHLALELYQASAKVKFLHVPYRGAAPALTDLLGGQVQAMFADAPVLMPQITSGKVRPLGAAADRRNPKLPDVPTLTEQGFPDTYADNWYGMLAPAKTPPAVLAKLNKAVADTLNDPSVKQKLIDSGAIPAPTTQAEFGALLKEELARWTKIVREKGIKEPG